MLPSTLSRLPQLRERVLSASWQAPILILAWRGSITVFDWINDLAGSPTLCIGCPPPAHYARGLCPQKEQSPSTGPVGARDGTQLSISEPNLSWSTPLLAATRWSGKTKDIRAHGAFVNLVENTFSLHEDAIVELIEKHKVERAFFTGHSLGGGVANVAHLVVRGQLQKAGSPWAKLEGKVTWSACTFAAPQTIVRLYESEKTPPLVVDLDASSHNVVYGCDAVPRIPGMLKYMGDIVEKVVPKVITSSLDEKKDEYVDTLSWITRGPARAALDKGLDVVENQLKGVPTAAVRFLKDKGIAEIVRHYTHQGTVVYLAPGALEYVQLKGAEIKKTLDVDGKAFDKLLGKESDWASSLGYAHSASYTTLKFKVK